MNAPVQWSSPSPAGPQQWPGLVPLRPLTVGEIIGIGLRLAWRNLAVLAPVGFLAGLLVTGADIGSLAVIGHLGDYADGSLLRALNRRAEQGLAPTGGQLATVVLPTLVTAVVGAALNFFAAGVATPLAAEMALRPQGARVGLRRLRTRWPVLLGAGVLAALLVMVGMVFLLVPGLILLAALQPVGAVAVMEGLSVRETLIRAARLTAGRRWRVFGVSLLGSLVVAPVALVGVALAQRLADHATTAFVLQQVASVLISTVTVSWTAMIGALLYVDLRMRTEDLGPRLLRAATGG
ncbi:hypothetical protein [Nakamurella endophytica]|uniref:DUF7847 domain-containing protein n=1 Tax=Nakamurella endophytica TaxID=1748367 RepID=A0A917SJW5_9ACTN|nr:hypothetical protein [Nakamurella endophytica]GGL86042.1 hypothetical protein GCM10011594_02150 [Nakamurella endophytica]